MNVLRTKKRHILTVLLFVLCLGVLSFYSSKISQSSNKETSVIRVQHHQQQTNQTQGQVRKSYKEKKGRLKPIVTYKSDHGEKQGTAFKIDLVNKYSELINLPSDSFVKPSRESWDSFVFATVIGQFNFAASLGLIASIQAKFPEKIIYVYYSHLKQKQEKKVQTICNTKLRQFQVSKYPKHVKKSSNGAYKVIIIQELLHNHSGVFWLDNSVRLSVSQNNIKQSLYPVLDRTGGIIQFIKSNFSVFALTRPGLYNYFPTNQEKLKDVKLYSTSALLVYRTKKVYQNILRWLTVCSLSEKCILPPPLGLPCTKFTLKNVSGRYFRSPFTGCYKFDQSILTILVANQYNFNDYLYTLSGSVPAVLIKAKLKGKDFEVEFC